MWSVNQNVWKIAPVCGDAVPRPQKHAGMSPANQRGRRSYLRRKRREKLDSMGRLVALAVSNAELFLKGGNRGPLN